MKQRTYQLTRPQRMPSPPKIENPTPPKKRKVEVKDKKEESEKYEEETPKKAITIDQYHAITVEPPQEVVTAKIDALVVDRNVLAAVMKGFELLEKSIKK